MCRNILPPSRSWAYGTASPIPGLLLSRRVAHFLAGVYSIEPYAPHHPEVFRVRSTDFVDAEPNLGIVIDTHREALTGKLG